MRNMRIIVWLSVGIAALLGVNILLTFNDSQDTAIVQRTSLLPFPDDAVSLIEISRGGVVESVLTHTGSWRLVEPFAGSVDEAVVLKLLDALAYAPLDDSLGDQELLRLGRTRADFGLESPRLAVRIRAGASETAISFGSPTPSASGVYAAIDDVRAVFVVPSNTFAAVDVPASGFRRRTLFTSGEESVASFDVKRGAGEFMRFRREGDGWLMVQPTEGPASLTKIKKLLSDVMSASAVDFVWPVGGSNEVAEASDALLAGYGLGAESAVTLTLKGTDGSDRRISFGSDAGEGRVYALVHNGAAVVTVDAALKDLVSPGNSALADTRLFPYETSQVSSISIADGGVACMLAKNEDGTWRMDSPISAAASSTAVDSLLSAVLALRGGDTDENGVEVSISADERKVRVSRAALGPGFRLENLRSLEILKIDPASVRRLSVTGSGTNGTESVVYDRDRRAWSVEVSSVKGTVSENGVARVLGVVNPLEAGRIVKLKVSADDLGGYGLEKPRLTVAIDLEREDAIRRNILVGDATDGGCFATVGASDAVFVLPESAVYDLSADIVEE
ncbi:MAG: DUF4340 domain-containing protein [Kiritimatiellae bacterium]|nr:DUF4340 domain-containing protein [Kiritimatiellia bacterium]